MHVCACACVPACAEPSLPLGTLFTTPPVHVRPDTLDTSQQALLVVDSTGALYDLSVGLLPYTHLTPDAAAAKAVDTLEDWFDGFVDAAMMFLLTSRLHRVLQAIAGIGGSQTWSAPHDPHGAAVLAGKRALQDLALAVQSWHCDAYHALARMAPPDEVFTIMRATDAAYGASRSLSPRLRPRCSFFVSGPRRLSCYATPSVA